MDRENIVTLYEVLQIIDGFDGDGKPNSFSITWCTLDKNKGSGGRFVSAENCKKVVGKKKGEIIFNKPPTAAASEKIAKSPNHYKHQTRNILVNNTLNIRKIHIRLITRFNGKIVSYG